MSLPFDLEDIVGVALTDLLKRVGLMLACVFGSPFAVALGYGLLDTVSSRSPYSLWESLGFGLLLFLVPLQSAWAMLYVPALLSAGFYFTKAEETSVKGFVILSGALSAIILATVADEGMSAAVVVGLIVSGFLGALAFISRLWSNRRRIEGESHLVGITLENQARREALRKAHGTDVADRDFVIDDSEPPDA